jgi:Ca-activated chloride channel family protein
MLMRCLILLCAFLSVPALAVRVDRPPVLVHVAAGVEPIELRRLAIHAEISGGMAETIVRMEFYNPNRRPLEGTLQFPLLDGQQVTAFALDIDGRMRPAVPVEKAKGHEVFEAIERRGVDPALLETTQGNNFKLRIYPIAAGGVRTVELKYAEPLVRHARQWAYRLPLDYGKVQEFALDLKFNGKDGAPPAIRGGLADLRFERGAADYHASIARQQFTPEGTLDIAVEAHEQPQVYRQSANGATYFVAEIPIAAAPSRRPAPRTIGLLWDSSGSGAKRALDAELAELDTYFKELGKVEVRLIRLRDRAEAPAAYQVRNGDWSALRRALEATVYDGASALNDWKPQADVDHYLLVSDGLVNYGAARAPTLAAHQRLFAMSSSVSADSARLSALAELNRGALVNVDPQRPGEAARALLFQQAGIEQLRGRGATDLVVQSRAAKDGMLRVAGRLLPTPGQQLVLTMSTGAEIVVPLDSATTDHPLAAMLWASWRLRLLEADPEAHRAEIGRIGRQFRIPTRETSLIVLDRIDDYLRYDVEPPPELKAAFDSLKALRGQTAALARSKHFDSVLRLFEQRVKWWNSEFPKLPPKPVEPLARTSDANEVRRFEYAPRQAQAAAIDVMPPPPPAPAPASAGGQVEIAGRRSRSTSAEATAAQAGIALKKWVANAPYMDRLRSAPADRVYALYLDEKPGYANSSAFYLDVADILIDKGNRDLALRVLSNLAEMDLENRALLRILGYRLLQAGAPQLALPVFEKVLRLAHEEPQSFRDLGLAHAAAGHPQQAIDNLYEVVVRPWDGRFPEIETIALAEINAIVASARTPLDTSRIDPRLVKNLPLDLRVVMTWDADNADMDLWVTDPNGERCYFGHALTSLGGRMSRDFTQGYGPEEFSLRRAAPGKYKIEANYYGNRQQVLAGATTLQVKLFSGFGSARQKEQVITLRLKDKGETIYVGEFDMPSSATR